MKSLLGIIGLTLCASHSQYGINIENWLSHPEIRKIRVIYETIQRGIENGTYQRKKREFDIDAPSCLTYPLKSQAAYIDLQGRVRKYVIRQRISDGDTLELERYYDEEGHLRFAFDTLHEKRIYLDRFGKVIWSVTKEAHGWLVEDSHKGDWETQPIKSDVILKLFASDPSCPKF